MDSPLDLDTAKLPALLDETFSPDVGGGSSADDDTVRLLSKISKPSKLAQSSYTAPSEEQRDGDDALRQERDALRAVNRSLEATFANLSTAKEKIERFGTTVQTTHSLMSLYTRLLSQATHTQQLLLDGQWERARDVQAQEEEAEAERRRAEDQARAAAEEAERLEREAKQREEARRQRDNPTSSGARGARGLNRARGSAISGRGRIASGTSQPPASSIPDAPPVRGRGSAPVAGVRGQRGLRSRVVTRGRGVRPPD